MTIFVKVQEEQYVNDMYENEYLYFSPLYGFRGNKEDSGRVDPKEGNLKNTQIGYLAIGEGEDKIVLSEVLSDFSAQYTEQLADPEINCCSLYALNIEVNKTPESLNEQMLSLGDKALIIYDPLKFYEIVDQSIKEAGYEFSRKFVKYYDPKKYDGDLTLHHKNDDFEFQNEYRILIAPTDNKGTKIPLPGLKEISTVIDSDTVQELRVTPIEE